MFTLQFNSSIQSQEPLPTPTQLPNPLLAHSPPKPLRWRGVSISQEAGKEVGGWRVGKGGGWGGSEGWVGGWGVGKEVGGWLGNRLGLAGGTLHPNDFCPGFKKLHQNPIGSR